MKKKNEFFFFGSSFCEHYGKNIIRSLFKFRFMFLFFFVDAFFSFFFLFLNFCLTYNILHSCYYSCKYDVFRINNVISSKRRHGGYRFLFKDSYKVHIRLV